MSEHVTTPAADTDTTVTTATSDFGLDAQSLSLGATVSDYLQRLRSGEVGSLPGILAFVVLCAVFTFTKDTFFTDVNMANLTQQAGWLAILAMGVTFVLLLGEIDLSVGATMGVTVAYVYLYTKTGASVPGWVGIGVSLIVGAGLALVIRRQVLAAGRPAQVALLSGGIPGLVVAVLLMTLAPNPVLAILVGMVVGAAMGAFGGLLVARVQIPSFVVTLALFLAWQGWLLKLAKEGGTIRGNEGTFKRAINSESMSPGLGWALFAVVVAGYVVFSLLQRTSRVRKGASAQAVSVILAKAAGIAVLWGFFTWRMNKNRAFENATKPLEGVPYIVPVILVLVVLTTFLLSRTPWGRHLYAVGGNAEAARRAGISVANVRLTAFAFAGFMASIAGIVYASRLNSVTPQTGTGGELLMAVGAAVVGGTSLFGGKGKMVNAVIGALVLSVIDNGLGLFQRLFGTDVDAGFKLIAAATVLLIAGSVDALTRRGGTAR